MSTTTTPVVPQVKFNNAELTDPQAVITYVRCESSTAHAGRTVVHFRYPDLSLLSNASLAVGKPLEVLLPSGPSAVKSVFKGEVVAIGFDSLGTTHLDPTIVVEAREKSHRLEASSTFVAHLDKKRSDIASEIARTHGLTAQTSTSADDAVVPYLLQHGSDHAFLSELAREIGFEWFVQDDELVFRPQGADKAVTLEPGDPLLSLSVRYRGTPVASEVKVLGWDPQQQSDITGTSNKVGSPGTLLNSTASFVETQYGNAKTAFGKPFSVGTRAIGSEAEATAHANAIVRDLVGTHLEVEGQAYGVPGLRAGAYVTLANLGADVNGDYYLTDVVHEFTEELDTRTTFACRGHEVEAARDAGVTSDVFGTNGLVVGQVTKINDPDNQGRVKVRYPVLGTSAESDWARVVAMGAGAQRGWDFRPEVGDEVLVGFDRGDVRFPYVLGGLWSGQNALPDTAATDANNVKKRLYKSAKGHQVVIQEGEGGDATSGIQLITAGGNQLDLTEDGATLEIGGDKPLTIKAAGSEITFGASGALTIKCSTLKVEAQQTANVEAKGGALNLKGANTKVESTANLEVKAGAMGKLQATGILEVKGSLVKVN